MNDAEFTPLISFPDESPSFVVGFEAGMIWQRMQQQEEVIVPEFPLHHDNVEVFFRMAKAAGYDFKYAECKGYEETWIDAVFTHNPRLRVVK